MEVFVDSGHGIESIEAVADAIATLVSPKGSGRGALRPGQSARRSDAAFPDGRSARFPPRYSAP
jgi:hypothetical protein